MKCCHYRKGHWLKRNCQHSRSWKSLDKSYTTFLVTNVILFFTSVWNAWRVYWGGPNEVNYLGFHRQWDSVSNGTNGKTHFPKIWGISRNTFGSVKSKAKERKPWIYLYQSEREVHQKGTRSHLSYCRKWWQSEAR